VNRRGPLIAGVVAGVLALLLVFFLVLPKMGDVGEANEQLEQAETQEQQLQLQLQQLQEAQAEAPETTEEIRQLEELIPPTVDLEGLILLLSGAANRAGVDVLTVAPGTPTPNTEQTFSIIPTAVTATGSYFALEEFLYNVETLPRAAKVLSLTVAPGGAAGGEAGETTGEPAAPASPGVTGELSAQFSMEFYTTDLSAGPGSEPGPSEQTGDSVIGVPSPPAPGA
jgi:Tfp pilus assembly protein PilO